MKILYTTPADLSAKEATKILDIQKQRFIAISKDLPRTKIRKDTPKPHFFYSKQHIFQLWTIKNTMNLSWEKATKELKRQIQNNPLIIIQED